MNRRKALWKDFFMEIKTTLNRFLSIFMIVALGVAFFAGIRATNPDMRITADNYFDASNLMDIRILSTLGLTEDDVTAIADIEGVKEVEPTYSTQVVCKAGDNALVVEVLSETENINKIDISEGRRPETDHEVLVDEYFITSTGYQLGDSIKLTSGSEDKLEDTMSNDEFTIVGIGSSSYYLSFQRGSSDIGTGKVNSFLVVSPEAFNLEAYTQVYVTVDNALEATSYTDEYNNLVENVLEKIENIASDREQTRYDDIYIPANDEIQTAKTDLTEAREKAASEFKKSETDLETNKPYMSAEDILAAQNKLEVAKADAEEEFTKAEVEITDAEADLAKLELPTWYVLDRSSIEAYAEFEQNADRIGAIGKVFPAIFFLVAALISLTTMTRMVEEERIEIGTLKALGYSKKSIATKYILYALLASLGGSIFGSMIGLKVLPTVIITAYKMMYPNIPEVLTPFNAYYASYATILAVFCVEIATAFACYKEMLSKPAELMRPIAPKNGKRVFLERVPIIWNRFNFTWKATIRNLLRYKKRFFMTTFGIGGCMALLLVGFGIRDSIYVVYTRQFDEIMIYDASVSIDSKATDNQKKDLKEKIDTDSRIGSSLKIQNTTVDIITDGQAKSVSMFVPEDADQFSDFVICRKRVGHDEYLLNNDGVILTEQIASQLDLKPGDKITISAEDKQVEVEVSAITENYMTHYLYMSPELYQKTFDMEADYNQYLLLMPGVDKQSELEVGNDLLEIPAAEGIFYTSYYQDLLANVLVGLNIVVWVLIISAGALAFIVLYNLNNININERKRELATIKVLGFYDNEMAAYVYRENIILTLIGAAFGVVMGIILHHYVIITVEVDMMMFGRNINPSSFLYSILLTILFSAIVNFVMFFKLRKINMVESLKSVE
ncbi:MAG: FtsX-like permease family protein [Mobilitalea sp.]